MAAIDAWLSSPTSCRSPTLSSTRPPRRPICRRLQLVSLGFALMGFGDLFIAAALGALLAADPRLQLCGAALAAILALAFDLLFFSIDSSRPRSRSPCTCLLELWSRRGLSPG